MLRALFLGCLLFPSAALAQSAGGGTPVGSSGSGAGGGATNGTGVCASVNYSDGQLDDSSYNAVSVTQGPTTFCGITGFTQAQLPLWFKIYDKASAPDPTADTPVMIIYLSPQALIPTLPPLQLQNGLAFAITAGQPSDNTLPQIGTYPIQGLNIGYRQ